MPKRSSKKPSEDLNQTAHRVVAEATGETEKSTATKPTVKVAEKNPAAVALGRLGGAKGGKARAAKLTKKQRADIARKGGLARWKRAE